MEIESAGGSGNITVTLSDGAEQSQTLTYPTPNGLPGIERTGPMSGVNATNYTDSNGKKWFADEVDFTTGKLVKHIQSVTLDGTQYVQKQTDGFGITTGLSQTYYNAAISNYFNFQDTSKVQLLEGGWLRIFDPDGKWSSVEDFKAWLSETTPVVYAALATPIETDLTPEQITAYAALTTYKPNTTVTTDSSPAAGIEVKYVADTGVDVLLAEKQDKLLGETTQLAGFDEDGNLIAREVLPEDIGAIAEPEEGETGQYLQKTDTGASWSDGPDLSDYAKS